VLAGKASGSLRMAGGAPTEVDARLDDVNVVDPKARFTLAGLGGQLRWNAGAQAQASELRWDSGALYGIGLGAARFAFSSSGGELRLSAPAAIAALDGQLRLEQLHWRPREGGHGARFQFGLAVDRLDLGSLSQRLGWPPFTGSRPKRHPRPQVSPGITDEVSNGTIARHAVYPL